MRGRWKRARHVEATEKNYLRLAFESEGGGGGGILCVTGVSSELTKKKWEKTGNDKCRWAFS